MKRCSVFLTAVILAVISFTSQSNGYEINLYEPFNATKTRLENIKPLALDKLLASITKLLGCLSAGNSTLFAEAELQSIPSFRLKLDMPTNLADKISKYMQTEDFRQIHKFLWDAGSQWNDVIGFLYTYGFRGEGRDIYAWFKQQYLDNGAPTDLDPPLPDGPPTFHKKSNNAKYQSKRQLSDFQLSSLFQNEPGNCNEEELLNIIKELFESQGLQWLDLIRFVIREYNSNPAYHVFWAKFTEPSKGDYFREFRLLEAITNLLDVLDRNLKANELFILVIGILEGLTGIRFSELNINVVGSLVSIVEFFIWGTAFPFPVFPENP